MHPEPAHPVTENELLQLLSLIATFTMYDTPQIGSFHQPEKHDMITAEESYASQPSSSCPYRV